MAAPKSKVTVWEISKIKHPCRARRWPRLAQGIALARLLHGAKGGGKLGERGRSGMITLTHGITSKKKTALCLEGLLPNIVPVLLVFGVETCPFSQQLNASHHCENRFT